MAGLIPSHALKEWLDEWALRYEQPDFIPADPICMPHRYARREDIEAVGLMTALIAWGRRSSILQSADSMFADLGDSPVAFLVDASEDDLLGLTWAHRTFLPEDGWRFMKALQSWYRTHSTLETAFSHKVGESDLGPAIDRFREALPASGYIHVLPNTSPPLPKGLPRNAPPSICVGWSASGAGRRFGLWTVVPAPPLLPLGCAHRKCGPRLGIDPTQSQR